MTPVEFARWGLAWPATHPETGEPFTTGTFQRNMNRQQIRWPRPERPSRQVAAAVETWLDEDGDEHESVTAWRDLTDAEWAEVMTSYEAAVRRWDETGGIAFTPGQTTTTGTFKTGSGATASGDYGGGRWCWREWEAPVEP